MFKTITALVLLMAFVSQTFAGPFIMLDYYLNTAAYSKNCINKLRPKMHCNGKCQAMKKIREEEKKEQQEDRQKAEGKMQQAISTGFISLPIQPLILLTAKAAPSVRKYPVKDMAYAIFHPPRKQPHFKI